MFFLLVFLLLKDSKAFFWVVRRKAWTDLQYLQVKVAALREATLLSSSFRVCVTQNSSSVRSLVAVGCPVYLLYKTNRLWLLAADHLAPHYPWQVSATLSVWHRTVFEFAPAQLRAQLIKSILKSWNEDRKMAVISHQSPWRDCQIRIRWSRAHRSKYGIHLTGWKERMVHSCWLLEVTDKASSTMAVGLCLSH